MCKFAQPILKQLQLQQPNSSLNQALVVGLDLERFDYQDYFKDTKFYWQGYFKLSSLYSFLEFACFGSGKDHSVKYFAYYKDLIYLEGEGSSDHQKDCTMMLALLATNDLYDPFFTLNSTQYLVKDLHLL